MFHCGNSMKKVLFISYIFPPLGGAGVQRSQKFVQFLPASGFLPIVVAGPGATDSRWTPRDASLTVPADVRILRVPEHPPFPSSTVRKRFGKLFALPTAFSRWWIRSATQLALSVIEEADVIFATMSPFESATVASEVSRISGKPWIADLRDPWALDETVVYMSAMHRKIELARMRRLLWTASSIILNTPAAANALIRSFPEFHLRAVSAITNGFDLEDFSDAVLPRTNKKFRIVHAGTLLTDTGIAVNRRRWHRLLGGAQPSADISARSPLFLLEAIQQWQTHRPEIAQDIELVFAGVASDQERSLANSFRIAGDVQFIGYVPHCESLALVRTADLLFLPMHNLPEGRPSLTVPAKTYEYMASGRPILAAVPDGDAREFLSRCGTGLICRPDDIAAMVKILNQVYSSWKTGQSIVSSDTEYVRQFDRRVLTRTLAAVLNRVISQSPLPERQDADRLPLGTLTSA